MSYKTNFVNAARWGFHGQYLRSLSINYDAINKDFEMKFYFIVVSVSIKISKGVISLLWQLRCHCNPDHNKFYSLSNTAAVVVIYSHTWELRPWKTPSSHLKLNKFTMASLPWRPFPYSPYLPRFSGACVLVCAVSLTWVVITSFPDG